MKSKIFFLTISAALLFSACSDNFLTRYPQGSTLVQEQYDNLDDLLEGTAMGMYSKLYEYGGDHQTFGKRTLDMAGDLFCGDMAMPKVSYGWFQIDELGQTYGRRSYIWSYYYNIIRLCNLAINAIEVTATPELPQAGATPDDIEVSRGFYYGQILAMRGFAYSQLIQYFSMMRDDYTDGLYDDYEVLPIYTETYTQTDEIIGQPLATTYEVYKQLEGDLKTAIAFLDAYEAYTTRNSKLEINADVARNILAYAYLNWGDHNAEALRYATEVINRGQYQIIPQNSYLTNGFNNVDDASWMWGQNVTIENTTALASFWGQMDIHTYSYAWAGDVKGIDDALYDEIQKMKWDGRLHWWNSGDAKEYPYAPSGKFFSAKSKRSTNVNDIDHDWLSDNVYMRIESAYLTAAEACYKQAKLDSAVLFLDALMVQRLDTTATAQNDYTTYKSTLTSNDAAIKDAIIYNWRVEMWGEGYGLQTFRRLQKSKTLGKNHYTRKERQINATGNEGKIIFTFEIPDSEYRYNRMLNTTTLAQNE